MSVDLRIDDPAWRDAIERIDDACTQAVAAALEAVGLSSEGCDVSILLASDSAVAELNNRFRGRDGATNVLSWPSLPFEKPVCAEKDLHSMLGAAARAPDQRVFLGDVALAFGVVRQEAVSDFKSLEAHLSHLIVHGVLHLLGYDHEEENEAEAMAAREIAALSAIGVADPYREGGAKPASREAPLK